MKSKHEMVRSKARFPFEDTEMVKFLARRIEELSRYKSQREIAAEIGYDRPNIISMFKRGETKVPVGRVPSFARALDVDPAHLFRLALQQQMPEVAEVMQEVIGNTVTSNEFEIVQAVRESAKHFDPMATSEQINQVKAIFSR